MQFGTKYFTEETLMTFSILKTGERIDRMVDQFNNVQHSIKCTCPYDEKTATFLDTMIFKETDNSLAVKTYNNSADKKSCLHFKPYFSAHLKQNCPMGNSLGGILSFKIMLNWIVRDWLSSSKIMVTLKGLWLMLFHMPISLIKVHCFK